MYFVWKYYPSDIAYDAVDRDVGAAVDDDDVEHDDGAIAKDLFACFVR